MIGLAIALGLILIVYFETTPNTTNADKESQEDEEDKTIHLTLQIFRLRSRKLLTRN